MPCCGRERMVTLTESDVLTRTEAATLDDVRSLNLWGLNLTDVSLLARLPNLEVLSLSVNRCVCAPFQPLGGQNHSTRRGVNPLLLGPAGLCWGASVKIRECGLTVDNPLHAVVRLGRQRDHVQATCTMQPAAGALRPEERHRQPG